MRCPFCGHLETTVKDSRPADEDAAIRRRRECPGCGKRFTTREKVEFRAITAIKSGGRREPFDSSKLVRSMQVALRKRPVSMETIEDIAAQIVREIETGGEAEVTTREIGDRVLAALLGVDEVSAVRYASVYRDFQSFRDFADFIDDLKRNRKPKPSVLTNAPLRALG